MSKSNETNFDFASSFSDKEEFGNNAKKNSLILIRIKKFFSNYPINEQKLYNILTVIMSIIGYFLYYLSLGGCDGTQTECLKNSNIAYYYVLANYVFISASIASCIIFLMIIKQISRKHLIHQIIIYFFLFISDTGSTLMNHGIYNIIGFFIFLAFYGIILFMLKFIQNILAKRSLPKKLISINCVIIIFIILRSLYHKSLKDACIDWDLGLNNTRIKDDKDIYPCQIDRPVTCHLNFFNNKQDLSKLLKLNCGNDDNSNQDLNSRNLLVKYINRKELQNTKIFGFPLTNNEKFNITPLLSPPMFTSIVYKNIIDMEKDGGKLKPEEYPEVILSFEEKNVTQKGKNTKRYVGKISINITRNETLSIERKKNESPDSLFNNVLIIYTDATSRNHFKRKMPKTAEFIEKLMKNNFEIDYYNELNNNKANNKHYNPQNEQNHNNEYLRNLTQINNKIIQRKKTQKLQKLTNKITKHTTDK